MASQQDLLSALQGLSQQAYATKAPQPVVVAPTTRTASPPRMGASGAPNVLDTIVKQANTVPLNPLSQKTRAAQQGLNTYARSQGMKYPNVLDEIQAAAAGQVKPSGALGVLAHILDNPIAKTVLKPLEVLDTGRRAVISTVREVVDILDHDKNTKASLTDWFNQTKDVSYGFGTAFPVKGNWGRALGLFGDLALDPINWLTLGASIPENLALRAGESALMRGAGMAAEELAALGPEAVARMAAEEVARSAASQEGVKLAKLLGSRQSGRGFATNLAKLADGMGASAELVQDIALRGRTALGRTEEGIALAKRIGLPESGLYVVGTKVKVPFTGPIAEMLERGIVRSRIAVAGSRGGEWLAENFTTKGTSAARNMQPLRRGLRTGKLVVDGKLQRMDAELARYAVRMETMDNSARALENIMMDAYAKRVAPFLEQADIKAAGPELYKFLDTPKFKADGITLNWAREMTPTEEVAYNKVKQIFKDFHTEVEAKYQLVDKAFTLNAQENYLPHMMTDEARDWLNSLTTARAEEIRQYLKLNMTDPASSFKSRGLIEGANFFGKELTKDDVLGGVERLNQIANQATDGFAGKFFETDLDKIMTKYGQHYAQQFGTAEFMRLAVEGGILAEAKQMGTVSKEWLKETAAYAKRVEQAMKVAHSEMRQSGSAAITALKDYMTVLTKEGGFAKEEVQALTKGLKEVGTPEEMLKKLEAAQQLVARAAEKQKQAWFKFVNARAENTAVVDMLQSVLDDLDVAWNDLTKSLDEMVMNHPKIISELGVTLDQPAGQAMVMLDGKMRSIDSAIASLDLKGQRAAEALKEAEDQFAKITRLDNVLNGIAGGHLKVIESDDIWDNIVHALAEEDIHIQGYKPMTPKNIGPLWTNERIIGTDMQVIKSTIDPTGSISNAALSRLTIEDVKSRVANAVTSGASGASLKELREAGVWLIVRDAMNDPEFATALANDIRGAGAMQGATRSRYSNLVELLRQADATETFMFRDTEGRLARSVAKINDNIYNATVLRDDMLEALDAGMENGVYAGIVPEELITEKIAEQNKKIAEYEKRLKNLTKGQNEYARGAIENANKINGFREVVADLGAGISEYYLHRESYNQLRSLQDAMTHVGRVVDQQNYNKILSNVARPELKATIEHQNGLIELQDFFTNVRKRVESIPDRKPTKQQVEAIRQSLLEEEVVYPQMVEVSGSLNEEFNKLWNKKLVQLNSGEVKPEASVIQEEYNKLASTFSDKKGFDPRNTMQGKTYKPTGKKITEKAGEWGPRKEEILQRQTTRSQDITRSITLREELAKIFRVQKVGKGFQKKEITDALRIQELIRKHLPELESVLMQDKLAEVNRVFYRHPQAIYLEEEVLKLLRERGENPVWGRPLTRRARSVDMRGFNQTEDLSGFRLSSVSSAGQYDKLRGNIQESIARLKQIEVPYVAKKINPVRQKIDELEKLYAKIMTEIEQDQKIALEAGKRLTGKGSMKEINKVINRAIRNGKEFGYSGIIDSALNGSDKHVTQLFAELLGGDLYEYSGTRAARQYRTINAGDSYFGLIYERNANRIKGLRVLTEETSLPLDKLLQGVEGRSIDGKYIPGAWLMRKELRGANSLADFLEEYANELNRRIGLRKEINTAEKASQRELLRLEGAVPEIGPPKPTTRPFTAKLNEDVVMEIPAQGKSMRSVVREQVDNELIQAQLDELASTPEYARAARRESEHRFLNVLAKFDEATAEQIGFTPAEFNALWNDPLKPIEINRLESQLNTLEKTHARLRSTRKNLLVKRADTTAIDGQLQKVEDLLLDVEKQVLEYRSSRSALEKLTVIHDNFADFARQQEAGVSFAFKFKTGPNGPQPLLPEDALQQLVDKYGVKALEEDVKARTNYLQKIRLNSDEYKFMRNYKETEGRLSVKMQQQWANERSNIVNFQDRIRMKVSQLRGNSVDNANEIANLEAQILDELQSANIKPRAKGGQALADETLRRAEDVRARPAEAIPGELLTDAQIEQQLGGLPLSKGAGVDGKYFRPDSGAIEAGTTPKQLEIAAEKARVDSLAEEVINLNLRKIVIEGRQQEVLDALSKMTTEQRSIIARKLQTSRELEQAMKAGQKLETQTGAKTLGGKAAKSRQVLTDAQKVMSEAEAAYDSAVNYATWAPDALEDARKVVSDLKDMAMKGTKVKKTVKAGTDAWVSDVDNFIEEASTLLNSIDGDELPNHIRAAVTDFASKKAEYFKQVQRLDDAKVEKLFADGLKGMEYTANLGSKMPIALRGRVPEEAYSIVPMFDEGFVQLSKYFPNIGVKKELESIVKSVHRFNEPQIVREFGRFTSKYTKFFKAYATLSPGFHARNAMSNAFMIFAAGGELKYMNEGLEMSRSWLNASKRGLNVDEWIKELPQAMQTKAKTAMDAFMASGGGMSSDFFDLGRLPKGTKRSKELGRWVENHSRFVLAWDGVSKGMDFDAAATRVRKYLIDYADVSTADQVMRQIVPFWMWTSRNLPLQIGNMWLNPRAYAIYNTIKRNVRSDKEGDVVPQWMREIGAFKLPFGNNLYATPDFGFNRVGQQIQELADPQRLLSNVNPLLRVPIELMGGRQLYNNRQFSDKPVQVGNGAGAVLQPFLAAAGYGETRDGKQFVNDKAYYAVRNLIPFLGTAERLTPSIDTYQQRGYVNPLLGFLGVPGRQLKEQEIQSELARRKGEIAKIASREKAFGE